jgi:NADH-quinone oxidoreductase subunit L
VARFVWLLLGFPLAGFLVLTLAGRRLGRTTIAAVGVGSVTAAAATAVVLATGLVTTHAGSLDQRLWTWMEGGGLRVAMGLRLDPLAVVMTLVVTIVGALIHLYATEFMADDPSYARFFAGMNLFVASMLALVLADDLILLYLGWEGVGLCSYLLIGFWYQDPANGAAAQKAFIVTRVGDAAMALGLFVLFRELATLDINQVLVRSAAAWPHGSSTATWAAALLLGGALGKSAQLPLHTWLPDAMAGPTPVSALIHAATMVTAGVYLIARLHPLFALAPGVLLAVGIIGAATMLMASFAALAQNDIKRVLAWSTVSQIGLMFLALGVGAWAAAIFHLVTHACFKALLFLSAGSVTHSVHHEHDIRRMGGLWRELPSTYVAFVIGAASLSAMPLVTAGFYSKELVLWQAYEAHRAGLALWLAGVVGAFLTALYAFRLVFLVFHGPAHAHVTARAGWRMHAPLVVLSVLAVVVGFLEMPGDLGGVNVFSSFLAPVLPQPPAVEAGLGLELALQLIATVLALAGLGFAWVWFVRGARAVSRRFDVPGLEGALGAFFRSGFGFDALYDRLFVRPYLALARLSRRDVFDLVPRAVAALAEVFNDLFARTQTGRLRWYVGAVGLGAVIVLLVGVLT